MKKSMIGRLLVGSRLLFVAVGLVLFSLRQPMALSLAVSACGLLDLLAGGAMLLQG